MPSCQLVGQVSISPDRGRSVLITRPGWAAEDREAMLTIRPQRAHVRDGGRAVDHVGQRDPEPLPSRRRPRLRSAGWTAGVGDEDVEAAQRAAAPRTPGNPPPPRRPPSRPASRARAARSSAASRTRPRRAPGRPRSLRGQACAWPGPGRAKRRRWRRPPQSEVHGNRSGSPPRSAISGRGPGIPAAMRRRASRIRIAIQER